MLKALLTLLLIICFGGAVVAQEGQQESNLKAAFIYNFTRYVDWDPGMQEDEFVIGVVGPSRIVNALSEIARNNFVNNRSIKIKYFSKPEDIEYCNILFISQRSPFSLQSILNKVNRGTLTISEQAGFARDGTAFNFVIVNDKLKFEANLKAINAAGLKAGSQLLKLAIIVE